MQVQTSPFPPHCRKTEWGCLTTQFLKRILAQTTFHRWAQRQRALYPVKNLTMVTVCSPYMVDFGEALVHYEPIQYWTHFSPKPCSRQCLHSAFGKILNYLQLQDRKKSLLKWRAVKTFSMWNTFSMYDLIWKNIHMCVCKHTDTVR